MIGYTYLVYGDGGVGKTWLALSAPGRKLLLDAEGRTDSLPGEVVFWDGRGIFPECGLNAVVVVPCPNAEALGKIVNALKSGKLPVESVILDSLTQLQLTEVDDRFDGQVDGRQGWGQLLKLIAPPVQQLMKLAKKDNAISTVVLVAWHKEFGPPDDQRIKPFIDGQLAQRLSHLTDVVGYLTVRRLAKNKVRQLQIEPTSGVQAKNTYTALEKHDGFIQNPNIETLNKEMSN